MNTDKRSTLTLFIAMLLIVAAGLFVSLDYINEFPTHIHAWAEQDHYALSLGFLHNGFDFFHPETMIYNKQFPGWWKEAYDTTITSAGFPIHEYVVALWMKIFGSDSPWVFRSWTLLVALAGLFFLFKICLQITQDAAKALITTGVAITSPILAYYMSGFLPSIPAFSVCIVGIWCYLCYLDKNSKKQFHLSIAFLTLAMLIRTTFAIALVAVLCFEMLRILRKESPWLDKWPSVLLSVVSFILCSLWNRHLEQGHGTLFLNQLLPAESWQDAKELLSEAYHTWTYHYFQRLHYWIFLALVILAVAITFYLFITKKKQKDTVTKKHLSLWWLPIIQLFGCLLFTIAMMQQIEHHDYYFIDTFMLPLLLVFALTLRAIPKPKNKYLVGTTYLVALFLLMVMVKNVTQTQESRRHWEHYTQHTYENFEDSDLLLDSLGIAKDAKILCLYGYPQNGPFIQMKRKGFIVMEDKDELLEAAINFPFDCAVIENEKYAIYHEKRPFLFSRLKKIGSNGKISVFLPT